MLPSQSIAGTADLDTVLDELRAADLDLGSVTRSSTVPRTDAVKPDHPVIAAIQATCRELGEPEPVLGGSFGGGPGSAGPMARCCTSAPAGAMARGADDTLSSIVSSWLRASTPSVPAIFGVTWFVGESTEGHWWQRQRCSRRISIQMRWVLDPALSPAGAVAYVLKYPHPDNREERYRYELVAIDPPVIAEDGVERRLLPGFDAVVRRPRWSPSGETLAF